LIVRAVHVLGPLGRTVLGGPAVDLVADGVQLVERRPPSVCRGVAVFVDEDRVEQCAVESTPSFVCGALVERLWCVQKRQPSFTTSTPTASWWASWASCREISPRSRGLLHE